MFLIKSAKHKKMLPLSGVVLFSFAVLYIFSTPINAAGKAPPGFEEIAQGQTVWVEVALYGQPLGLFSAHIDLQNVTFTDPDKLQQAITEHYNRDPQLATLVNQALAHPLARNGQLACSSRGESNGCDHIDTESLAVIYDENSSKVSLFLNKNYLPDVKQDKIYHQQTNSTENALIHQQNINFVAGKDSQSASIQGNGALGITQTGHLGIDWNYQTQKYRTQSYSSGNINNFYFRQDLFKRYYVQLGRMDSRDIYSNSGGNIGFNQLPIGTIEGVRIGSSLAWLNLREASRGSPVNLFLSRSARVDAYRGEQLLSVFYLKSGAQTLDTSSFPYGSYNVTLKIYEDNQLTRTETIPYVNSELNSAHGNQWFLQAGRMPKSSGSNNSSDQDQRLIIGGLKVPIGLSWQLTSGAALAEQDGFWENVINWNRGFDNRLFKGVMSATGTYLVGNEGTRGNTQQISYRDGYSLSLYRSQRTTTNCDSRDSAGQYSFGNCYESTSVNFSLPVAGWNWSSSYILSSSRGRYRYGYQLPSDGDGNVLPWQQVYESYSRSETWQTGVNRSFYIKNINLFTSASLYSQRYSDSDRPDNGLMLSISLSGFDSHPHKGRNHSYSAGVNYEKSRYNRQQINYNVDYNSYSGTNNENQWGAALNGFNSDSFNGMLSGRTSGKYGNGNLVFSDSYDTYTGKHYLSGSGNYTSALALARSGLYWGKWSTNEPAAGVAVKATADEQPDDGRIDINLSNAGHSYINGRGRALFAVRGYQPTTVNVSESTSPKKGVHSEIKEGSARQDLFLSPGKLFVKALMTRVSYTYLGRAVTSSNQPISDAVPLNVRQFAVIGQGGFSLETDMPLTELYLVDAYQIYQCPAKVKSIRDVVRFLGTIRCQDISATRLPTALQEKAKLLLARYQRNGGNRAVYTSQHEAQ